MNRLFVICTVALALAGCATPYDPAPDIHDVAGPAALVQVQQDVADCAKYARAYKRPLSVVGVATATGQGVTGNLSTAAVNVLGPVLGGVGGFVGALLQWFGLVDTDTPKADQQCVRQRLDRDHAGILVEAPL